MNQTMHMQALQRQMFGFASHTANQIWRNDVPWVIADARQPEILAGNTLTLDVRGSSSWEPIEDWRID